MGILKNNTSKNALKPSFCIEELVLLYFNDVVTTDDFIIAIDEAGVFLFSALEDEDEILIKAYSVMKELALTPDQIVICSVTYSARESNNAFFSYKPSLSLDTSSKVYKINPDDFEGSLRLILSKRPRIFDKDDIIEITEVYQDSSFNQDQLNILLRPFHLSTDVIANLRNNCPPTIQDVVLCGVPSASAEQVFKIIQEYKNAHELIEESESTEFFDIFTNKRTSNESFMCVSLFLVGIVAIIFKVYALSALCGFIGFIYAIHVSVVYRTLWSSFFKVSHLILIVTSFVYCAPLIVPYIQEFLQKNLLAGK